MFAAALRNTLADAGKDGWGAAATASSAAFGTLFFLLIAIGAPSRTRLPTLVIPRSLRG
jgi:hypothetical protein